MASLVDKNLVRVIHAADDEPRFRMLETIREYALQRPAESGEERAVRLRYAEHLIGVAERAAETRSSSDQVAWIQRLELNHDDFSSALAWAADEAEAEPDRDWPWFWRTPGCSPAMFARGCGDFPDCWRFRLPLRTLACERGRSSPRRTSAAGSPTPRPT